MLFKGYLAVMIISFSMKYLGDKPSLMELVGGSN